MGKARAKKQGTPKKGTPKKGTPKKGTRPASTGNGSVILSEEDFAVLFSYLWRQNQTVWDPRYVGQTMKLGERLWARVREMTQETYGHQVPPGAVLKPPAGGEFVPSAAWKV